MEKAIETNVVECTKAEWEAIANDLMSISRSNYVDLGRMLIEIKNRNMYMVAGYPTFEIAIADKFCMAASRAYQLISAYGTYSALQKYGIDANLLPINEGQCRELMRVAKSNSEMGKDGAVYAKAIEIWRELIQSGKIPTAKQIAAYGVAPADGTDTPDTDTTDADGTDDATDTTATADTDTKPVSVVVAIRDFKKQLQVFEIKEDEKEKVKNRLQSLQREIKKILKKLEA